MGERETANTDRDSLKEEINSTPKQRKQKKNQRKQQSKRQAKRDTWERNSWTGAASKNTGTFEMEGRTEREARELQK
jgi:hypothetical protein